MNFNMSNFYSNFRTREKTVSIKNNYITFQQLFLKVIKCSTKVVKTFKSAGLLASKLLT